MAEPESAPSKPRSRAGALYLAFPFILIVAVGGYFAFLHYVSQPDPFKLPSPQTLPSQKLAEGYVDADGDLIADAPTDPAKLQKVDEIGFHVVSGSDPKKTREEWKDFLAALEKATGKKVVYRETLDDQRSRLAALRDGKLQIAGFSTGEVPTAVNMAGFVPLAAPADADGKYSYEMEILVPAASAVQTPADLKGKTVGFTAMSSNSGAKAPMVILKEKFHLLPGRDYNVTITGGHERSIRDLAAGKLEAVCVANDLLAGAVKAGIIKPEQFRSIYKSASFPPLCIGAAHDLPPEIMAKVKQVFQDFRFAGTSLENRYGKQGKVRFAAVDYKKDWVYVREIDDALARLLDPE